MCSVISHPGLLQPCSRGHQGSILTIVGAAQLWGVWTRPARDLEQKMGRGGTTVRKPKMMLTTTWDMGAQPLASAVQGPQALCMVPCPCVDSGLPGVLPAVWDP